MLDTHGISPLKTHKLVRDNLLQHTIPSFMFRGAKLFPCLKTYERKLKCIS